MGDEPTIEEEIIQKGLTAPRITEEHIINIIQKVDYYMAPESTHTVCIMTLLNGFVITGESACASVENFDVEIGQRIAYRSAANKIWALEGYLLKQKIYEDKLNLG